MKLPINTIKKAITIIIVFKSYVDCILLPPKKGRCKRLAKSNKLIL